MFSFESQFQQVLYIRKISIGQALGFKLYKKKIVEKFATLSEIISSSIALVPTAQALWHKPLKLYSIDTENSSVKCKGRPCNLQCNLPLQIKNS